MIHSMTAPCSWPVDQRCLPDNADPLIVEESVNAAVGVLWALTGRRFGVCPTEARPCPPGTVGRGIPLQSGPGWAPHLNSGVVRNSPTCTTVGCDRSGAILLPGPVRELLAFHVDGEDIDLSSIIVEGDRIWRRGGLPWPDQRLDLPAGSPGTWSIRYTRGTPPPAGAAHAVGTLAREFYAVCTGGRCQLPRRTTQVQRQGVTVTMMDPSDIYASGATGITEVDLWIRAHNPHRLAEQSTIWSPDMEVW